MVPAMALDTTELIDGISAVSGRNHLPGVGYLTINSFVLDGPEPILIDTQVASERRSFLDNLRQLVDPEDLRWVAITHTDADHIGNLAAVLDMAPNASLVTNYTGFIKLSTHSPVDPRRVRLVRSGDEFMLGERRFTALRPPLYDAPETLAWFDHDSRHLFAADCFGAMEPETDRQPRHLPNDEFADAMSWWVSIDTPWAHLVDPVKFRDGVATVESLGPTSIRAGHLPLYLDDPGTLIAGLLNSLNGQQFLGPSHQEFMALLS